MEQPTGTIIDTRTGPNVKTLVAAGFDLYFESRRSDFTMVDEESGQVFQTECEIMAMPRRKPALRSPNPCGASVRTNIPVEMFAIESEHGRTDLRDRFAEQCAKQLVKMLKQEAPAALK